MQRRAAVINLETYWQGRDVAYPDELTDELRANAAETVFRVNNLLMIYYQQKPDAKRVTGVNSGWRPKSVNDATPNASHTSWHLQCKAVDLADNGPFDKWCFEHPEELAKCKLWQEHPGWTDGWCHLQTEPPRGGPQYRTFIPNKSAPMTEVYGWHNVIYPVG